MPASLSASSRPFPATWIPAMIGVAIICCESTNTMGANHTDQWLRVLANWIGHPDGPLALLNHLLRKSGHFTGYGLLGLCFTRGWYSFLRRRVTGSWYRIRTLAATLGIFCTFVVASADEIHQIFLPERGASAWDVLLDTSGALVLNLILFALLAMHRQALLNPQAEFTTLGLNWASHTGRVRNSVHESVHSMKATAQQTKRSIQRNIRSRSLNDRTH